MEPGTSDPPTQSDPQPEKGRGREGSDTIERQIDILTAPARRDQEASPVIILASGSPRRARVLRQLGIAFETRVPSVDEAPLPEEGPAALAVRLAREKATRGAEPRRVAFGFDTIVAHGGEVLGKPSSPREAVGMIERLAGSEHEVFSGIAAATPERVETAVERTRVWFRELAAGEAARYVATGEALDKAGAYGIQGAGAALVRAIEGDFFNVMGFPIQRFLDLLGAFGLRYDFHGVVPQGSGGRGGPATEE